jgi:hypothetical protein
MKTKPLPLNEIVLFSILLTIVGLSAWWAASTYRNTLNIEPRVQVVSEVKPRDSVDLVQIMEIKSLDQIQPGLQSYWMVESEGNFRVVNDSDKALAVTLSVATMSDPCGEVKSVDAVWPGGSGQALIETKEVLQINLSLYPRLSQTVHLATSSKACVIASDTRVFYGGVDVQIIQVTELQN